MKQNKETSCNCFNGAGRELMGRDDEGGLTNVQNKPNQNCHYESLPYNEYILIKIYKKEMT
jgi:hypothetical protein